MLKHRIMTALLLVPITLLILFYASPLGFCFATGILALAGAWEWSNLMGLKKIGARLFYLILTAVIFCAAFFIPLIFPIIYCFIGVFIWWLVAAILIIRYPNASTCWGSGVVVRGFMGFIVLIPCWLALNIIRNEEYGIYTLLFLLFLIWGADTFAYFAGKKWGKNKLLPLVSPGKTWQGLLGALIGSTVIALIALKLCGIPLPSWPWVILLSLVTVIFSVIGDLFESMLKRHVGIKDSGKLLPGHGGLLDRIDSLTAAAPVFILWQWLLLGYV